MSDQDREQTRVFDMHVARFVYARVQHVICPHCEEQVEDWLGDPRDTEMTCDSCKKQFRVAADADVRLV